MVAKQRIRMANEKHSKNITQRGNVAKSTVSLSTAAASVKKNRRKWLKTNSRDTERTSSLKCTGFSKSELVRRLKNQSSPSQTQFTPWHSPRK